MSDIPIEDQIAEVRREIAMRERVYPNFILKGRLTREGAKRQLDRLKAVLATLEAIEAKGRLI